MNKLGLVIDECLKHIFAEEITKSMFVEQIFLDEFFPPNFCAALENMYTSREVIAHDTAVLFMSHKLARVVQKYLNFRYSTMSKTSTNMKLL